MKRYEVNNDTLAIVACNEELSKVYEKERSFYVESGSNRIMEDSCEYFGSSLEGRRKGTEAMIGVNYKAPIIVEESNNIIFFPTSSFRSEDNSWVSLKHFKRCYSCGKDVIIEFDNHVKIKLSISLGVLNNQVLRSSLLDSKLRARKEKKHFKRDFFVI